MDASHVIIPARFESSRLPGKVLMDLQGQTIIERVYRQAQLAKPKSITIATDNAAIVDAVRGFGADVVMTSTSHQSGTARIAEAVSTLKLASNDLVVNVQGDEPLIAPELIQQVAESLMGTSAPMATLCWPIDDYEQSINPNVVKVVRDVNNHALYFSRSPIPFHRDEPQSIEQMFRHIGLYAYRAGFLQAMVTWPACSLALAESLEQLSVLRAGYQIKVDDACLLPLQDINTLDDLIMARKQLAQPRL